MANSNDKAQKAVELLKEQARLQQEMNGSLDGYLKSVEKYNAIQKTITANIKIAEKFQNELIAARKAGDIVAIRAARLKLKILKDESRELEEQGVLLNENLKQVNKGNLVMAKGFSSAVKIAANLPKIFKQVYGQIKGSGLFEMDKSMKKSALQMGVLTKQTDGFRSGIKDAAMTTLEIGVGVEDLAKIQGEYSSELGRAVMLGKEGLIAMGEIAAATGLGAEGTARMAADLENQGVSAERTRDFIEQTMNDTHKMGLNASKVIKNIQGNVKMLNKYNFKGGVKGLAKMAETTTKLGVDMKFVTGMADKLFDIEGAVDMSAQLQVMGGEWAKLGDPFKLMFMARNDMEGLTEAMGKAAEASVHFNDKTGEFEISALEMHKLRKVAEQTGVSYEELATAGKNAAKFTKLKGQMGFEVDKETQEFLSTTAQLDEKGRGYIKIGADKKFLSQLTSSDKDLLKKQIQEKASLTERAKSARTFDDALTNTLNMFKTAMLPLIETLNNKLIPKIDGFVKRFQDGKWAEKIGNFATTIGKMVSFFGGWVIDNPIKSAFIAGGAMLTGVILEKASWIMNGVMLAQGFNKTASLGGGTGQFGGKGLGMRNAGAMDRAGMGTMGKVGANFKGGLGSTVTKLGGVVAGLTTAYSEWTENSEAGMDTGENVGRTGMKGAGAGLGAWGGAAAGAAIGSVVPVIGTLIGGIIGGALGAWGGGALGEGAGDLAFGDEMDDAIVSGGKITPIDNKDDLMAYKPNGPIDNSMKATQPSSMKIDFGEIHFKFDELKVTSPGSPGVAIDLLKDQNFLRNITRLVHVETSKAIQGGKVKP